MFIDNCWKKFHSSCSFKLLILSLIIIWLLNLLFFYHIESLNYNRTSVHILKQVFPDEKNKIIENVKKIGRTNCMRGNFSVSVSNEILQLKGKLKTFYYTRGDFSYLSQRCLRFIQEPNSYFKIPLDNGEFNSKNVKLIEILKTSDILKVENAPKGTQLKLLAHMINNISALIKPKWYSPFDIIFGAVYAGKDRHYGEILAFYLSILLDMPRVPFVVSRKFDLQREIISKCDGKLLDTFLIQGNQTCFYGVCPYCSPSDLLCLDSTILEGAVIYYLPSSLKLRILRHPWRRTYRCSSIARWEVEEHYCNVVRNSKFYANERNKELFLDLIDTSIFDFLISNGDRHHYEFIDLSEKPRILLIDNGKSFGSPYIDHIDILAPLYHCCVLRNSTWNNLLQLRGGNLSEWLQYLLKNSDDIIINKMHFKALDRRLIIIFSTIEYCILKKGLESVIK